MNKNELKSVMIKNSDTQKDLAKVLNISLSCLNAKMNEKSCFWQKEIELIKKRYNLSATDIDNIFFSY